MNVTGHTATCARCAAANPPDARFCMDCGAAITQACTACGAEAPERAHYCIKCGAALGGASAGPPVPNEERRTVTVLFADLVGYTSVSERLDHETVKTLTDRCLTRLAREVERYGGFVDQYIGDNVMAVFGAPVAHEDDAERAVRAGWGMQAAMGDLNQVIVPEYGFELALRVGVNTGEVLAGRVGGQYTVVGDAVNVAARLQGAAPVGGVLVGARTRRMSSRAAAFRPIGALALKGKADAVEAWEVTSVSDRPGAPGAEAPRTPLVGRRTELSQLRALFERVDRDGAPHAVTVLGEAGVGKTRLLREFERELERAAPHARVISGRCHAFGSGTYWPLAEMLREQCEIVSGDTPADVRAKLAARFAEHIALSEGQDHVEHRIVPLARLLGAEERLDGAVEEDQQGVRESFFGAVRAALEALAGGRVLVLAWEDIHWADEGTLSLIEYLAQWLRAPVLQVCLARDELLERQPTWGAPRRGASSIFLEPLTIGEARELIEALARQSGADVRAPGELAERSGGNALFAEALVDRYGESAPGDSAALPDTLQSLLAMRLDALSAHERELIGHAAVVGRSFPQSALESVAAASGTDLAGSLAKLCAKNLIEIGERDEWAGEPVFAFRHVLIRDAAYESLPRAVRARKHAEIGEFVELRIGARGGDAVSLLADHFACAAHLAREAHLPAEEVLRMGVKALEFSEAAGDGAAAMFTNEQALAHYRAAGSFAEPGSGVGMRLLEKAGDVEMRLGHLDAAIEAWSACLDHHTALRDAGRSAQLRRKIAAALVQRGEKDAAMEQLQAAVVLLRDGSASLELVRLYEEGAWLFAQLGNNVSAIYACERALRLAEDLGEPRIASRAHGTLGRVLGRMGNAANAGEHLERAVELAREHGPGEEVFALMAAASNREHCEGDYVSARAGYVEALSVAERIGDLAAQIELRAALAELAFHRCAWEEAARESDASAQLAEREGLISKLCFAHIVKARLRWREGDWDASEHLFREAHDAALGAGWSEVGASALTGLARTLADRGEAPAAEIALTRALAVCESAGLLSQAVHANALLAFVLSLSQEPERALLAAEQAVAVAARVQDPAAHAAAIEARGVAGEIAEAREVLSRALAGWERLGRRLEAARCALLLGRRILDVDREGAARVLDGAAATFEEIGVEHLAGQARDLLCA